MHVVTEHNTYAPDTHKHTPSYHDCFSSIYFWHVFMYHDAHMVDSYIHLHHVAKAVIVIKSGFRLKIAKTRDNHGGPNAKIGGNTKNGVVVTSLLQVRFIISWK